MPVDLGFTPDASFPVVYGEKAGCGFNIEGHVEKGGLIYLCAGNRPNIVPETCEAVITGNYKQYVDSYRKFLNANNLVGEIEEEGNHTKLILKGKSAHASTPDEGINAIIFHNLHKRFEIFQSFHQNSYHEDNVNQVLF